MKTIKTIHNQAFAKIGILQLNFTIGNFLENAQRVAEAYEQAVREGADFIVAPELGICGYPPRDLLNRADFLQSHDRAIQELTKRI